jgi:hypothetical protein
MGHVGRGIGHVGKQMRRRIFTCGDYGVREGEYHVQGCDMEPCPKCSGQLISCTCRGKKKMAAVPFIQLSIITCARCGKKDPPFMAPDDVWYFIFYHG